MNYDAWDKCVAQIMALPEDEQMVMSLRYEHGMNAAEIAATLGIEVEDVIRLHAQAIMKCQPELV
jgi:DNA-directed RNA polymerase specialized sigma subunit